MQAIEDAIKLARKHVEQDPNLAIFIVRDYEEVKLFQMDDLAWAMYKNYATKSEVVWFLDELEKRLKEKGQ